MKKLQFLLFLATSITGFASINSMDQSFTEQQNTAKQELADYYTSHLIDQDRNHCEILANHLINEHGKTPESLNAYMKKVNHLKFLMKSTILPNQKDTKKERNQVKDFADQDKANYNRCKHDL